jgi:hypothetical protein
MNEQELRALVRESIERHLGRPDSGARDKGQGANLTSTRDNYPTFTSHPSHVFLRVVAGSDVDDGMCVIEPAVRCNHCGFCQSYGH